MTSKNSSQGRVLVSFLLIVGCLAAAAGIIGYLVKTKPEAERTEREHLGVLVAAETVRASDQDVALRAQGVVQPGACRRAGSRGDRPRPLAERKPRSRRACPSPRAARSPRRPRLPADGQLVDRRREPRGARAPGRTKPWRRRGARVGRRLGAVTRGSGGEPSRRGNRSSPPRKSVFRRPRAPPAERASASAGRPSARRSTG